MDTVENFLATAGNNSPRFSSSSFNSVCFPRAGLPVGDDAAIVALQNGVHNLACTPVVNLLLVRAVMKRMKREKVDLRGLTLKAYIRQWDC